MHLQDDHDSIMREVLQDYLGKAEAFRADLNDKRLTVEHMVLAMAEVGCFAGYAALHVQISGSATVVGAATA